MYWQYKAILIAVIILIALGLGVLIWRSLPTGVTGQVAEVVREPFAADEDSGSDEPAEVGGAVGAGEDIAGDSGLEPSSGVVAPGAETLSRLESAEEQFTAENLVAARELAHRVLSSADVEEFDRVWYRAAQLVSNINAIFMSSEAPCPEKVAYTIQSGDSLSRIGGKQHTTVGALQRLNDLDPTNPVIYPGHVLYVLRGDWSIRVVKSQFVLLLVNGDRLYRLYRVGIGRQNRTPVGTFVISSKVIHPAWTPPGKHIPYGDPENVLGTHWLGLTPTGETSSTLRGYGIHGTWEPETVGTAASAGCVRMENEDVGELFDFVPKPVGNGPRVRVLIED